MNLAVDSLTSQIKDTAISKQNRPAPKKVSLLAKGEATEDLQISRQETLESIVLHHSSRENTEQYNSDLQSKDQSDSSTTTKTLAEISEVWEAISEQDQIVTSFETKIPQRPPVIPAPPPDFFNKLSKSFGHCTMATSNPQHSDVIEEDPMSLNHEGQPPTTHPSIPPPMSHDGNDIQELDSDIDMEDQPSSPPVPGKGFRREDRKSDTEVSSEESPVLTGKSTEARPKRKEQPAIKTTVAPPQLDPQPTMDTHLAKAVYDQGEILGKLTSSITKISDNQVTLSDDLRAVHDLIAKQTQLLQDLIKSVDQLREGLPIPTGTKQTDDMPATSGAKKRSFTPGETADRERMRQYYIQHIQPFNLKQLKVDLMVDMWTTAYSVRKASFLSRFPGIEWADAFAHVLEGKVSLTEPLLQQEDTELASYYYLSKKNRLASHPGLSSTSVQGPSIVTGLDTPAETTTSRLESMRATGRPIFDIRSMRRK